MSLSLSALLHSFKQDVAVHTSASLFQISLLIKTGIKSIKFLKTTDMFGDLTIKVTNNEPIVF